jgi:hypothetical protein
MRGVLCPRRRENLGRRAPYATGWEARCTRSAALGAGSRDSSDGLTPQHSATDTQAWNTFVHNHASEVLACDFFVTVTATFRLVYVFLVLEIGTRQIVHWNITEHPTAEWTVQQFRTCVTGDEPYRFVIHDHDRIYSPAVDRALMSMHLRVLKTPVHVPQANAYCERLIGTARRECLDFRDPAERAASAAATGRVGAPLQCRPPARQSRPWYSRSIARARRATITRSRATAGSSSCREAHPWRASPRIQT